MKHPDTISDMAICKTVTINGKKCGGIRSISVEYNCDKVATEVTLKIAIKKQSMKIVGDEISFDTFFEEK